MPVNTTDTYWAADGESLHTFAHSIESLGGLMKGVGLRGDDTLIPFKPGEVWEPKVPGPQVLNLGMWVRGVDWDHGSGAYVVTKPLFQANWNRLVRLLWTPDRQINLQKRFYDYLGTTPTLYTATAKAQFNGGLEPQMMGRTAGRCVVDLKLTDPYFYDDVLGSATLVTGNNTVVVPGNAKTLNIQVTITGARNNTTIRNNTTGVQFTYPANLLTGASATVNAFTFGATETPSGGAAFDSSAKVVHTGAPQWLNLQPGSNIINVASTSGIGVITMQYRGAWI